MEKNLEILNLDKKEYKTYKALLQLSPTSIRDIAAATEINRGTTHEILKKLVKIGLVSYQLKGRRRHYLAEPPEKLLNVAFQKRLELERLIKNLKLQIIPELLTKRYAQKKPTARYYEGEEGVEKVLQDVLQTMETKTNKAYFAYSAQPLRKYLYRLFPNFTKQRIKKNIAVKVIALGEGGQEAKLSERKWLPVKRKDSFSSYIIIYADKFALISLAYDELPYAVVIHEPGIVNTQKLLFKTLWSLL